MAGDVGAAAASARTDGGLHRGEGRLADGCRRLLPGSAIPDPGPLYYPAVLLLRLETAGADRAGRLAAARAPGARRGVGLVLVMGLGLAAVLAFCRRRPTVTSCRRFRSWRSWRRSGWRRWPSAGARRGALAVMRGAWRGQTSAAGAGLAVPAGVLRSTAGRRRHGGRVISVGWGEGLDQVAHGR